jgi:hypothetical protein
MEPVLFFALPLKAGIANAPETLQLKLIKLKCDIKPKNKFL